ncbi:MAG TPA: tRNA guanosine(15) transglycosylase TgtA [Candidatus Lokiarchaeia archaeon]|nr:tRNA guanosine(15) transglycosylase TgtA [Candidatus Lokiarchaeia archaeon]
MAPFEVLAKEAMGRLGKLEINGKQLITPNILPVVHPKWQFISPMEMHDRFGVDAIFTNAYIIFKDDKLRPAVVEKGLHAYLDFPGIIATDSGAFQHYMYGTDDLKADEIEPFQEAIGSDLGVILDQPVQIDDPRAVAAAKVMTTIQRARDNVERRASTKTGWYGPIHGSRFTDLLEQSARSIGELDFAVHALGGVVKLFNQYEFSMVARIVLAAKAFMDPSKPVHLFGAGHPMVFSLFVALGCDLFDSAAYTLFAKEGRYITASGTWLLDHLTEFPCSCPVCIDYTPAEMLAAPEQERTRLLSEHNLHVTMEELRIIREHMRAESLWQLVETRCKAHPKLLEALRVAQACGLGELVEEPVFKNRAIFYTGPETLQRPEVIHYRNYFMDRYEIPGDVSTIIVVPELDVNAVASPQHQKWLAIIDAACDGTHLKREDVVVTVLNPILGLIPEDLLHMYPLSHNVFPIVQDQDQHAMMDDALARFVQRTDVAGKHVIVMIPDTFMAELGIEIAYDVTFLHQLVERCNNLPGANPLILVSTEHELQEVLETMQG